MLPEATPGRPDALFTLSAGTTRSQGLRPGLNASALLHIGAVLVLGLTYPFKPGRPPQRDTRLPPVPVVYEPGPPIAPPSRKGVPRQSRGVRPRSVSLKIGDEASEAVVVVPPEETTQVPFPEREPVGREEGNGPGGKEGGRVGASGDADKEGCLGCTGEGPVLDVDRGPRLLSNPRPVYPQEAFVKKVQGTVEVQILIDETGHVADTRILRSIPLLDAAAVAAVRKWSFEPATKQGRAVATWADAPIQFALH